MKLINALASILTVLMTVVISNHNTVASPLLPDPDPSMQQHEKVVTTTTTTNTHNPIATPLRPDSWTNPRHEREVAPIVETTTTRYRSVCYENCRRDFGTCKKRRIYWFVCFPSRSLHNPMCHLGFGGYEM